MKKLGTPIGAGPGNDSEKDGFAADGTPLPVGSAAWGRAFLCLAPGVVTVAGDGREEDFWPWPALLGDGVVLDREVVVEDELDPGLGLGPGLEPELGLVVVLAEVVVEEDELTVGSGTVGVVVAGGVVVHDWLVIVAPGIGVSAEAGVPGATL